MSAGAEAGPERAPRPNPFAFPSDTTFRFALLVAAVLGATLYIWNWIWTVVGADKERIVAASLECLALAQSGADPGVFNTCVSVTFRPSTWWMLGGVALVVVVAAVLVLVWPALKERRRGYRPLEPEDAPDVLATLSALSREAGLAREPRWTWNPLRAEATGAAYGYPGRHSVALTGGLVVRHATDPAAFRAIVRHELAHIRNRDVTVTYATLSLWYAFLAAAVVPFTITLANTGRVVVDVLWRMLVLAALVYLTRNAVLRSRETYADVRASLVDGADGALERVVGGLPPTRDDLVGRLLALHPSPRRRLAAIRDTGPLFELGWIAAFAAGLAATITFDSVSLLASWWISDPADAGLVAAVVFAPLVVGVVGVGLWRDRFGAIAGGSRLEAVAPLAVALTAGLLLGPELSLLDAVTPNERSLLGDLVRGEGLLWVIALLLLVWLLLAWFASSASVWLRAVPQAARAAAAVGLLVGAVALTLVLGTYFLLRGLSPVIAFSKSLTAGQHAQVDAVAWAGPRWLWQLVMDPQTLVLLKRPLIPLAIVAMWAFTLAAALVRRRGAVHVDWAFLDPGGLIETEPPRVSLGRPLLVGAGVGLLCLLAYAAYRAGIHGLVDLETRFQDEFVLGFFFWHLVIGLGAQALAGGVAAALARNEARIAEGLCAASVAGTIAVAGIVLGPVAGGCVDPLSIRPGPCTWDVSADFTWDVWRQLIAQGAVVAVAASLVVIGAQALLRRRPAGELRTPGPSSA